MTPRIDEVMSVAGTTHTCKLITILIMMVSVLRMPKRPLALKQLRQVTASSHKSHVLIHTETHLRTHAQ